MFHFPNSREPYNIFLVVDNEKPTDQTYDEMNTASNFFVGGKHWSLLFFQRRNGTFHIFDPMNRKKTQEIKDNKILEYDYLMLNFVADAFNYSTDQQQQPINVVIIDSVQQDNGKDCGFFVEENTECILGKNGSRFSGTAPHSNPTDIKELRATMANFARIFPNLKDAQMVCVEDLFHFNF